MLECFNHPVTAPLVVMIIAPSLVYSLYRIGKALHKMYKEYIFEIVEKHLGLYWACDKNVGNIASKVRDHGRQIRRLGSQAHSDRTCYNSELKSLKERLAKLEEKQKGRKK